MATSRFGDPKQTLYLVDISSFIFRAFFAIRSLSNKKGEPTNAVYGVATMMARLVEEAKPEFLTIVYDSKEPSFRKEVYPEYKANRSAPPDDLLPQFDRIEQLINCLEISSYRQSGFEADDIIATLAIKWCAENPKHRVVLVTGDKDLMQLVNDRVVLWDTMANKVYGPADVEEKFGVKPLQIRDYLGLVGDSSDNIPGVPSIGPKSAVDLLKAYGDVTGILAAAKNGDIAGKKGEVLKTHEKTALLSVELATLKMDIPVEVDLKKMAYRFHVTEDCGTLLKELDFHSLHERWMGKEASNAANAASGDVKGDGADSTLSSTAGTGLNASASFPSASAAREPGERATVTVTIIPTKPDSERFRTIRTEKEFEELLTGIENAGEFGFDIETTSLNPREAKLVGIAICYDREFGCYIPLQHRTHPAQGSFDLSGSGSRSSAAKLSDMGQLGAPLSGTEGDEASPGVRDPSQLPQNYVLERLTPYLENPKYGKIGQNLKYDFGVLAEMGLKPKGILADTMVADYVLDPEGRHNLEALALKYCDYSVMTYEDVCGKGKDQTCFDLVPIELATRYSGEDAWIAVRLWDLMKPKLEAQKLMSVFTEIDLPLVMILSEMERQGVEIDTEWLAQLSREFDTELKAIELKIQEFTKKPINLNSPKQLAQLLFEDLKLPPQGKTKTGFSTDAKVLEALADLHEIPKLLMEYREISKLKGTYVDPLPELKDPKTGRIHASFNQAVAATGRLSSSDPNLQNIPIRSKRGQKIRKAFIPSRGNVLVSADYSQIELRLLAHMSGDPELVNSFRTEEDVHKRTASEIFGITPDQVDDRQRGIAKAINFGLMYGKSAFGLSQELKIPRKEAQEVIDKYFQRYRAVKIFLDQQIQEAREKGWTATLAGRKRTLHDINAKNPAMRSIAERMAMNTPIQGTAADLMKIAMIRLDEALKKNLKLGAKLLIQVHDEVVLECPEKNVPEVQKLIVDAMEGAMQLNVPLKVNASTGSNWMDL